jgi:molecular chaperone GrpE
VNQHNSTDAINEDNARPESAPEMPVDSPEVTQDEATQDTEPLPNMAALEKQVKEYLEGWQRERSEFANYKKRVERDMKDLASSASAQTLMSLLPIIDDFERAFANIPAELENNAWTNGMQSIYRKFQKLLDEQGITAIDPTGELFDPTKHEAVGMEDSDSVESGHVTATLQKGYARGEKVLRPALVKVAN